MQEIELFMNEQIIQIVKGDYWPSTFLFLYEQRTGEIIITNMRILFKNKIFTKIFIDLNINITEIDKIEKCNVGTIIPINPTGIKIIMKDGKIHKLSSYHRKEIINAIQKLI